MKNPKFSYTQRFIEARKQFLEDQQSYIAEYNLFDEVISSMQHPEYFEIQERWIATRKKLDAPLIEDAYYRIGHVVSFVKINTYIDYEDIKKRPHLLRRKKLDRYYNSEDEFLNGQNPTEPSDVFYENVLTYGVIKAIRTSDAGTGEIVYDLKDLKPACPEVNPYVLEKDIITVFL